jgi:cell division protein FtsI/penicillin-binding protein 2
LLWSLALFLFLGVWAFGVPAKRPAAKPPLKAAAKSKATVKAAAKAPVRRPLRRRSYDPWKEPSFGDPTLGDLPDGEDPVVRKAAVDALGWFNGSVVVVDPATGRILSIVNQRLAFKPGFTPCSTIKLMTSLAGLSEGLVADRTSVIPIGRYTRMDMTEALAHSNNPYFARIGEKLGLDRIVYHARLLGLGERATLDTQQEEPGTIYQDPARAGGLGMMTSFGHGFQVSPLELAAMMSVIANRGTLFYLQYPRTPEEAARFQPRVKRQLDIGRWVDELKPGMLGAVEYGTGRRAYTEGGEQIYGKTGTCTDESSPTHLGWFGAFNEFGGKRLAVAVLLTGGRAVNGPVASGVAGAFFRNLIRAGYLQPERSAPVVSAEQAQ